MKKHRLQPRKLSAVLALVALALSVLAPVTIQAQTQTREKIRLMADALRARDEGELRRAKELLEELIRIEPGNADVQRLLESVNRDLERQMQGQPTVYGQAAGVDSEEVPVQRQPEPQPRPTTRRPGRGAVVVEQPEPEQEKGMAPEPKTSSIAAQSAGNLSAGQVRQLLEQAESEQMSLIQAAANRVSEAASMVEAGQLGEAESMLNNIAGNIPETAATDPVFKRINELRNQIILARVRQALDEGRVADARTLMDTYDEAVAQDGPGEELAERVAKAERNPKAIAIEQESPEFVETMRAVQDRLVRASTRYINGDLEGARFLLEEILILDPSNSAAKNLLRAIADLRYDNASLNHPLTRAEMLEEVSESWARPKVFEAPDDVLEDTRTDETEILERMEAIEIPRVSFSGDLNRVIETLNELSERFAEEAGVDPVNIVLLDPNNTNPQVRISLRNLSLRRILDFITRQVNFAYDVEQDAVVVRPSQRDPGTQLTTDFFEISRTLVTRLIGAPTGGGGDGGGDAFDPFAPADTGGGGGGTPAREEAEALIDFFESAGVPFRNIEGASLAYDGGQLIVTNTIENLRRISRILQTYDETQLVEIEAKFLEVEQEDLEELGFDWTINSDGFALFNPDGTPRIDSAGNPVLGYNNTFDTGLRTLQGAFGIDPQESSLIIDRAGESPNLIGASAPDIPGTIGVGGGDANVFTANGGFNGADIEFAINALSRKEGSDLMSAPRLTVLSGRQATISVAQELLYPTEYGDITSQVTRGSGEGGVAGTPGVTITAGTPQDFEVRNIGVEMEVKPTVEENNKINLFLKPEVTEFEGFVEYGGPSVAIAGNTTVTVPAGFFQPIFATRTVTTEVTVFDGATVVIGGLMREELRRVEDKVPVLGDVPLLGRFFSSEGEVNQKRNLMIFVTSNILSPGGSPSSQRLEQVQPNSLFQNPVIITPGGSVTRSPDE